MVIKEQGHASLLIKLEDGVITVLHGTDNVVLEQWTATAGDWDKIWEVIGILKAQAKYKELLNA